MKILQTPALACFIATASTSLSTAQAQAPQPPGDIRAFLEEVIDTIPVRVERRAEYFETLATTTPEDVEARLDNLEEEVLLFIDEMDPEAVSDVMNSFGAAITKFIETYPSFGEHLTDEQIERIVAAAIRASTMTPEEVEKMLKRAERIMVPALFASLDEQADDIAALINAIGYKALDLQAEVQDRRDNFNPPEPIKPTKPCKPSGPVSYC